ncbi:MAG: ABC transporter ATP-binding protein [Fervidicoccaceae archaeon]
MLSAKIESAGYVEGEAIIGNVSINAERGKLVLVGGRSGSGKTTLLFAITGILHTLLGGWVKGKVSYDEREDILALEDPVSASGKIYGFVLQDPDRQLLMPTPLDEVMFTLENFGSEENEAETRARELLNRFGLGEKMLKHVEDLSGGEKRRLSLASAIAHDPPVILFDEPTASLDPWGIRELRTFIAEQLRLGKTVIVVEHKAKYFLDLASEVVVLEGKGRAREFRELDEYDAVSRELDSLGVDASHVVSKRKDRNKKGWKVLEVKNLSCWYGNRDEEPLFEDVELELESGEIVALVGPNGSGKTTLLKAIAGIHKKCNGEVKISDENRKKPFYVPQVPEYLFIKNTLEEEILSLSKKTGKRIEKITEMLEFYEHRKSYSPYTLSLGQRRWLSAVIAWSYNPPLMLFDEPTVGLDKLMLSELFRRIENLKKEGASILISTHDPRVLAEVAERAYVLENRKLKECDPDEKGLELEEIAYGRL